MQAGQLPMALHNQGTSTYYCNYVLSPFIFWYSRVEFATTGVTKAVLCAILSVGWCK